MRNLKKIYSLKKILDFIVVNQLKIKLMMKISFDNYVNNFLKSPIVRSNTHMNNLRIMIRAGNF